MAIIRLQNKTPTVYTWESRDFQLISRVYDSVINEVKYNVDTLNTLTNTQFCKSNILPLLQTKVGFFTSKEIIDDTLRIILEAFPTLIKNKGSLLAIKQALIIFFKAYHIKTDLMVWSTTKDSSVYGTSVGDHTIIIGIQSALENMYILQEILKYILPSGFDFYIYFYTNVNEVMTLVHEQQAKLLFVSDNVNSQLRLSTEQNAVDPVSNLLTALDVTRLASSDSKLGTFLGFAQTAPLSASEGSTYILLNSDNTFECYYRSSNTWNKLNYKGVLANAPANPSTWDVWTIESSSTFTHYLYNGSTTVTTDSIHVMCTKILSD